MKIISNRRDLYDNIQAYGFDPNLVFVRHEETYTFGRDSSRPAPACFNNIGLSYLYSYVKSEKEKLTIQVSRRLIGFCGKGYQVWKVTITDNSGIYTDTKTNYFANVDDLESFLEENYPEFDEYFSNREDSKYGYQNWFTYSFGRELDAKFPIKFEDEVFRSINAPIFVIDKGDDKYGSSELIVNPNLQKYNFYAHLDPVTVYQEISMYLGGPLLQPVKVDDISDKAMLQKKGFNQHSFKQTSPGKKRKRRAKSS